MEIHFAKICVFCFNVATTTLLGEESVKAIETSSVARKVDIQYNENDPDSLGFSFQVI